MEEKKEKETIEMEKKKKVKIFLKCLPSAQLFFEVVGEYIFNLYNTLFKEAPEIIAIVDDEKWELHYENSQALRMLHNNDKPLYLDIENSNNRIKLSSCVVKEKINESVSPEQSLQVVTEIENLIYDIYEAWSKAEEKLQEILRNDKRFSKLMEEKLIKKLSGAK